mgnify:FL=1
MNKFYNKLHIYNKLNYNIQNIVLNKLFEKHKKWHQYAINISIKSIHKIKCRFFKPSIIKKKLILK